MSTPAYRMTSQKRTAAEQNDLNRRLLDAVFDYKQPALLAALKDGADPNAVGVTWPNDPEPSVNPPLVSAIYGENFEAFQTLIRAGANVGALDHKGEFGIVRAVRSGHDKMVEALLTAKRSLIDAGGINNLLYLAICSLGSYGILQNSTGVNAAAEAQLNILFDYHMEQMDPGVSLPKDPVVLDYKGNLDLVKTLLHYAPQHVIAKVKEGFSPLEVVQNPKKYAKEFWDCEGVRTIRCLPFEDAYPERLTFELTLCVRGGDPDTHFKAIVRYDFTELRRLLESYAPNHALAANVEHQKVRLQAVEQDLSAAQQQLTLVDKHLLAPLQEQERFEAWLAMHAAEGHKNLKVFYDTLYTRLGILVHGLTTIASDMAAVNLNDRHMGLLREVVGGLSALVKVAAIVPGAVATAAVIERGVKTVAERRQVNAARRIIESLGHEPQAALRTFARELTQAYTQQLLALAEPEVAEAQQSAPRKMFQKAKQRVLESDFESPAARVAAFALLWVVHRLHEPDLREAIDKDGLASVLLSTIIQKEPPKKLKDSDAKKRIKEVLGDGLPMKQGEPCDPLDLFTRTGICVRERDGMGIRYYTNKDRKPEKLGYCLVPEALQQTIPGLKLLPANKVSNLEPSPWFSDGSSRTNSSSGDYSNGKNSTPGSTNSSPNSSPEKPLPSLTPAYQALCAQRPPVLLDPLVARGELVNLPRVQQLKKK